MKPLVLPALVLLALAAAPFTGFGSGYLLTLLSRAMILAMAALSLSLLVGGAGLVSLGHAALVGVGAYTVAALDAAGITGALTVFPTAILAAATFALLTGAVSLRTSGVHFIMITLAFGQMAFFTAASLSILGGDDGYTLFARTGWFGMHPLRNRLIFYFLCLILLILAWLILSTVLDSRFGRVLRAAKQNSLRVETLGFSPYPYRLVAYTLAGAICGLAGALLANATEFVSPATLSWGRSGELLFMVILGGSGHLYGAILGALAIVLLEEWLSHLIEYWRLVFGPLLVLSVLFLRNGLAGLPLSLRVTHGPRWATIAPPDTASAPVSWPALCRPPTTLPPNRPVASYQRPDDAVPPAHTNERPMPEPLLHLKHLQKRFGGLTVTDNLSLTVRHNEIHAIIGPNGAGKSTLINLISGTLVPDRGTIHLAGHDITRWSLPHRARHGLARSFQITSIIPAFTALENVALAVQARSGSSFRFLRPAHRETALNDAARDVLNQAGLAHRTEVLTGTLSHGEKRQVELAIALATHPKLLLLDEPLAGAGTEETERLMALLQSLRGRFGILLIEHDMQAVFALADRISVLVQGRIIVTGPPAEIRDHPEVRTAYLGEDTLA